MNDFILENGHEGQLILKLQDSIRQPRIILPFIAGAIATAVTAIITPAAIQSLRSASGALAGIEAAFYLLVCGCFVVVALASFLQAAVAGFGTQAWIAAADRLEFQQEIFGWCLTKRVRGHVIVLSPPATMNSTSWKLAVTADSKSEHVWNERQIHISSDDEELRAIGNLLSGKTGWQFVDQSAH